MNPNPKILVDMISVRNNGCSNKHRYKFSYTDYFQREFDEPKEIGAGAFGTVVMAKEKSSGKLTAIKIIKLPGLKDKVT